MAYQSILNPMPVTGALTDTQLRATPVPVSGTVAFSNVTLAVTGAFYQATQPVSLASTTITGSVAVTGPLTDTQLRATPVPVSGTFYQATQPVSGTFFQATQPVSIATMPTTPVTGTFWQATQPVSLTSTTITGSVAVTGPLTDTQLRASAVPVSLATDSDVTATGTIAAISTAVTLALNGKSGVRLQITGTWVGTLQFEGTVDGTTWTAVNAVQAGASTIPQTTTTNGTFSPTPSGFASFRVNATAWTSGTATISIRASSGVGGTYLNQNLPAFAVIPAFKIDQTTPGATNLVSIGAGLSVIGKVTLSSGTVDVGVGADGSLRVSAGQIDRAPGIEELLAAILVEMRINNTMLQVGLSIKDDPADFRDDYRQQLN